MRIALLYVLLSCLCLLHIDYTFAANYSPVDGAFGREGHSYSRGYIGPARDYVDEEFHREAMQDSRFALADGLLNATWVLIKRQLSGNEYERVLQEQRRWISEGRDRAARRYMEDMSEVRAYAKATMDRVDALTRRIGVIPKNGSYSASRGEFRTTVQGGTVYIQGSAYRGQNTCEYTGRGSMGNGWITMRHDDYPDFYVLFTPYSAEVFYNTGGIEQGCGMGVDFSGSYARD